MPESVEWLTVGRLVGAQGLKGDLKVNPSSDFPERFTTPGPRWVRAKGGETQELQLIRGRQLPGRSLYVIHFEGVDNRDSAEALIGGELLVSAHDRPPLNDGEFHLLDLVGLSVRLEVQGPAIGTVTDLISAGNDLLEIKRTDGRITLVPFVEAIVPDVDLEEGWWRLTPPPGLLDL